MKNLFEITEKELRRELQKAYYEFKSGRSYELLGWLEDEYCNNPEIKFDAGEKDTRYYLFRFYRDFYGRVAIQYNGKYEWIDITMDHLVEKIWVIIKRDYQ